MTRVYLVGAGPGDPDLITLKAVRLLQRADVVLYDYLAHPNLLHYAERAKKICVGKKRGQHSKQQTQINVMMKRLAAQGKMVVRLKGGDPTVFGRGGEEMEFLRKHKIPYEIVPGVTAAIAVPTYAGIPITHRDLSKSVAFVTGSPKKGQTLADIHIPDADTIVFLMPVTNLSELAKRFPAETPAALIHSGATSAQTVEVGTVSTISKSKLLPPSILVVGKVAALAKSLNWYERLPLFGKRIILLRTLKQSSELRDELHDLGAEVITCPAIEIKPLSPKINLTGATMIIFTSPNGVEQFMKNRDSRSLAGKKIVAIGPKTAQALRQFGLIADLTPESYQSEGILEVLSKNLNDENILIPTAQGARDVLPDQLRKRGARVIMLPLYKNINPKIDVAINDGDYVVFTSSSTAHHFFSGGHNKNIVAFCLGPITANAVKQYFRGKLVISKQATAESLIQSIRRYR